MARAVTLPRETSRERIHVGSRGRGRVSARLSLLGLLAALGLLIIAAGQLLPGGREASNEGARTGAIPEAVKQQAERDYGKLPLRFEPNRGQTDRRVRFLSRGAGYSLFLTDREAVLSLTKDRPAAAGPSSPAARVARRKESATATVRIRPVGASPNARLRATERQPGSTNYLSGSDPSKWRKGVPGYGRVSYHGVYPGIDLVYHGGQQKLEYDFVVAPGADPDGIALQMKGAQRLSLSRRGDLILHTGAGAVRQQRPFVYQRVGKAKKQIEGRYVLKGKDRVAFSLGAYDRARPLVIDPVLAYSTYLGGSGDDNPAEIAIANGCVSNCEIYLTGTTASTDFPTENPAAEGFGGRGAKPLDAFVTKLNASGTELVYSTYLGGTGFDQGGGIAVDASGHAYVSGLTGGTLPQDCIGAAPPCPQDFPTMNPMQGYAGGYDVFVAKLGPAGSLVYSTFLGGTTDDWGYGIAVGPACTSNCDAYVIGRTLSPNFPTVNALRPVPAGLTDAFVTKVNPSGSALVYSTYLGGVDADIGLDIAVDASGSAYLAGNTRSNDFPTKNPYQDAVRGDSAFVTKLDPSGSTLAYSTFLGGTSVDSARSIAVDASGSAFLTGLTDSSDFPTKGSLPTQGPYQSAKGGGRDAFVTKLDPSGSTLAYSTFLGGASRDAGRAIAVDASGSAYLTGLTDSTDFPTEGPYQNPPSGANTAFVTKLGPSGSALSYSTFLGGSATEHDFPEGHGIVVDGSGSTYLTGPTSSSVFPTSLNPYQDVNKGLDDAYVTKLSPVADLSLAMTAAPNPVDTGQALTYTLSVRNAGPEDAGGTVRDVLPAGVTFVTASAGCSQAAGVVSCELSPVASGAIATREIVVRPMLPNPALSNTASLQSGGVDSNSTNDSATVTTVVQQAPVVPSPGGGTTGGVTSPITGTVAGSGLPQQLAPASGGTTTAMRLALRRCISRANRLSTRARRRAARIRCSRAGRPGGPRASAASASEIILSFRAPGSVGRGGPPARRYVIKQSTRPIRSERDFGRALTLCGRTCAFTPQRRGQRLSLRITELRSRRNYYYAVKAVGAGRRTGPRSETVRARTR